MISELHSLNTLALRPYGPDALCIFRLFNSLRTPFGSIEISSMGMNGRVPLEGISLSDPHVKAITNICLIKGVSFQDSIFSECSDPNVSFLSNLANNQSFFAFSRFWGQLGSGSSVSNDTFMFPICVPNDILNICSEPFVMDLNVKAA